MPGWSMSFVRDARRGFVEATFEGVVLATEDDVARWEKAVRAELAAFGGKVVLLINLDELQVRARAARAFGEARAGVLADHVERSFRYGGDGWTRTSINTSRVIYGADSNLYESREVALEALLGYLARR